METTCVNRTSHNSASPLNRDDNFVSRCNVQIDSCKNLLSSINKLESKRVNIGEGLPTPIKANRLAWYLTSYDADAKQYLINGFNHGFSLNNVSFTPSDNDKVLRSATLNPEVVQVKLQKEINQGRIIGPFESSPFAKHVISPLGLVEKKTPGEYRVIHHLSYPIGSSINDGIPREYASVHYTTISDAIDVILSYGKNCYLAKSDVKSAFRIIPIHPKDYPLLGMKWNNHYYFDRCLPMGASSSCAIFEKFSSAIEWIVQSKIGNATVLHVLDDFLFIGKSKFECQRALDIFLHICSDIGIPIAPEKTVSPTQFIKFLGID